MDSSVSSSRDAAGIAQVVADLSPALIAYVDREERYRYVNEAYGRWRNESPAHVVGKKLADILSPTKYAERRELFAAVFRGETVSFEDWIGEDDENGRLFQVTYTPDLDASGVVQGFVVHASDITAQRQAEQEREDVRRRMYEFLMQVPAPMAVLRGADLIFELANRAYSELVGTERKLVGRPLHDAIPDLPEEISTILTNVNQTGERFVGLEYPLRIDWGQGRQTVKYLNFIYEPIENPSGETEEIMVFGYDVTDQVLSRKAIEESEERIRTYAEAMPQMAFTADADGNIIYYNKRWYEFVNGMEGTEGWGWVEKQVLHPDDLDPTLKRWSKALKTGEPYQIEYRLRRHDGAYRWHLGRAVPARDETGRILRWYGTNTDIHDQKMAAEEHKRAKEEAERANKMKSDFLANMSHEIRTPVGVMVGFAELLADGESDAEGRQEYCEAIRRNGEQLSQLIDDILDLSKVEAGYVNIAKETVNVENVREETAAVFREKAQEKGLRFESSIEPGTPVEILADSLRVHQILWNLLSNAVKFTDAGRIRVHVYGSEGRIHFRVDDTGVGIPDDAKEKIFQVLTQADESVTRRYGGSGLGLALSKRLARLMGGELELLESKSGEGSSFLLTLPAPATLAQSEPTAAEKSETTKTGGLSESLKGKRVLLVEDRKDNQLVVEMMLAKQGATVVTAADGHAGVERALEWDPDLVLMDLQMPGMDGYTATQRLREKGFTKPVVALTAHAMAEAQEKAFAVGCDDHMAKPIDMAQLLQTMKRLTG